MDKKISYIKERILEIADYKRISKEKFIENFGMTYGNFKGKQKLTSLNSDFLDKILSEIPEINAEWLLTGKGEMLKEAVQPAVSSSQPQENDRYTVLLEENNAILKDQLRDKEEKEALYKEKIKRLEREITNLEKDLQQHKKTAQPTVSDILHQPTR